MGTGYRNRGSKKQVESFELENGEIVKLADNKGLMGCIIALNRQLTGAWGEIAELKRQIANLEQKNTLSLC